MTLIDRIIQLSGPMPDPEARRRYLSGKSQGALQARLEGLLLDASFAGRAEPDKGIFTRKLSTLAHRLQPA